MVVCMYQTISPKSNGIKTAGASTVYSDFFIKASTFRLLHLQRLLRLQWLGAGLLRSIGRGSGDWPTLRASRGEVT